MSNLIASLSQSAAAMNVFEQALGVVQNNVDNSSTAGYATQTLSLQALPFDVAGGLAGGVAARGLINSRDQYAEESVQNQNQLLGLYTSQAQSTGTVQSFFDVTGTSGLSAALNSLFQAFSSWSTTPSDTTARQTVISSTANVATAFQQLDNSLSQTSQQMDSQISSTVTQINDIASQIQQYNVQKLQSSQPDPGADAQLYSNLQTLSGLVNFSTVTQSDGTVTVMLEGGSPLVIGKQLNPLSVSDSVDNNPPAVNPQSPPTAYILDSSGNDVTSQVTGGQLGGLLDTRNGLLASYLGDSQQQGSLNELAQGLADTVNSILESGKVSSDAGAANGTALFTYSNTDPTDIARTLAVNPSITAAQLAPVDSSGNANGNANALAALSSSSSIDGMTYVQYYGQMAALVGQQNSDATTNEETQQQVLAQAESLRDQISGVSLDQQATQIIQFQNAYQAAAQVLTVLNNLAQTTLDMIATTSS